MQTNYNMANQQYKSTRKKNATPEEIMHDIRLIGKKNGVYVKGADIFGDYFWECIQRVRANSYYFAMRLEQLAYRYERAKRKFAEQAIADATRESKAAALHN